MISGRPETITTVHLLAAAHTLSIAALSAAENFMSLTGRRLAVVAGVIRPQRAADVAEPLGTRGSDRYVAIPE